MEFDGLCILRIGNTNDCTRHEWVNQFKMKMKQKVAHKKIRRLHFKVIIYKMQAWK